jgi:hypothetical protein
MTSNAQNCCIKFIIHKKKIVILHKRLVFNFVKASFYQNDVLVDYSMKMTGFMPILGLCVDVFRAAWS